jgi:hypothetical protein
MMKETLTGVGRREFLKRSLALSAFSALFANSEATPIVAEPNAKKTWAGDAIVADTRLQTIPQQDMEKLDEGQRLQPCHTEMEPMEALKPLSYVHVS